MKINFWGALARETKACRRDRLSFSLVELLVVMTILSILAAILLPVLITARKLAQSVQCMNNLRQQNAGFNIYQEGYGGYYPRDDWGYHPNRGWGVFLACELYNLPYPPPGCTDDNLANRINDKVKYTLLGCPGNPYLKRGWPLQTSYSANGRIVAMGGGSFAETYYRLDTRLSKYSTKIVLVYDGGVSISLTSGSSCMNGWSSIHPLTPPLPGTYGNPPDSNASPLFRHNLTANTLFLDGHVESRSWSRLRCRNLMGDYDTNSACANWFP